MRHKKYWSILVLVFVVAAIAMYVDSQRDLLAALENVSYVAVLWLIVLRLLFLATNGLFLREFARKFQIGLAPKEWFGLSVVTTMGNYVTPFSGGLIARAAYLKHRHDFPYAQFATLLASNYLVNFWVIGLIGLLSLLTFLGTSRFNWQMAVFFLAVTVSISMLVAFPSLRLPWHNRVAELVNTALEGWTLVKNDRRLLVRLVLFTLVNILVNGVSFWVAYRALDYMVSFPDALLISLLAAFSILVNVTPGNLGIQEAVIGLSSGLLGAGSGQGLLAALLIRAATLISVFALGPIFSFLLAKELTTHRLTDSVPVLNEAQDDPAT